MRDAIRLFVSLLLGLGRSHKALLAENMALRQQLAVYQRKAKRPKLTVRDRAFWVWLSRLWSDWQSVLVIVQPETVVGWHRQGFRLYWTWKSRRGQRGRRKVDSVNRFITLNEQHLRRPLANVVQYYHTARAH